jgi:integrase
LNSGSFRNGGIMETIKTKNGIRYREMVWLNNKSVKSPSFAKKTDAREWKANQMSNKKENSLIDEDALHLQDISFEKYANEWLDHKSQLALRTKQFYRSILDIHLIPFFKNKLLSGIKKNDGEMFINHLKKNKHNAKGTNTIVGVLKSIMIESRKTGHLITNPLEFLSKIKPDPQLEVYWTMTEINQFLLANNFNYLYPLYLLALNTGMRKGELAGLCWDRIDFHLNQITVSRTRDRFEWKETTKTNSKRIIPMNLVVRNMLTELRKKQLNPKFVFTEPDGSPVEVHHIYRRFHQCQKKAGFSYLIRFHDLRHTFASQFVMHNGNIFDLQKILGHTKIDMTMRYAHYSPDHLQKAMNVVSFGGELNVFSHNLASGLEIVG